MSWYKKAKILREGGSFGGVYFDVSVEGKYWAGTRDQPPEYPEAVIGEVTIEDVDEFANEFLFAGQWDAEFDKALEQYFDGMFSILGSVENVVMDFNGVRIKGRFADPKDSSSEFIVEDADVINSDDFVASLSSNLRESIEEEHLSSF